MITLERILSESRDPTQFAGGYLAYLSQLLERLDREAISAFIGELELARKNQNTVFLVGNGGSAATASHMTNALASGPELTKGIYPFVWYRGLTTCLL